MRETPQKRTESGNAASCVMRPRKGRFIEIFRTTPAETVCPNFYVLAHANGCVFRPACSYCYLKSSFWYLRRPRVFSNTAAMLREAARWIGRDGLESHMLNTGNLSDSLSFEQDRPVMPDLIELFRDKAAGRPHTLLVVTKGGVEHCSAFFKSEPCANVVVSFSVNAPAAAGRFERGAAAVADRMEAARRLKRAGWRVRIRIDPMIMGYDYRPLVRRVAWLRPERVTLGSLRSETNLPRHAGNGLFENLEPREAARGLARYPLGTRLNLYGPAVNILLNVCPTGLCEETPGVWDALGLDKRAKSCNCCV